MGSENVMTYGEYWSGGRSNGSVHSASLYYSTGPDSARGYTVNESREMEATSVWSEIPPLLTTNDIGHIMEETLYIFKKCNWMC